MQYCKCFLICCFLGLFSANLFSQSTPEDEDMTGLWTGLMYNDTTELNYRYEIAISKKKGKLIGYSHTYFILDDKEYYGVKKLKITIDGNKVITQDLKLVDNNYPIRPPKGVYVINVLVFEKNGRDMILSGMFSTNRTREYAPATGYIHVERKSDFMNSSLVPHLAGLGLDDELSFVQEEKERQTNLAKTEPVKKEKQTEAVTEPPVEKTEEVKMIAKNKVNDKSTELKTPTSGKEKNEVKADESVQKSEPVKSKTAEIKKQPVKKEVIEKSADEVAVKNNKPETAEPEKKANAASGLNKRTIETIQSVNYSSDSLIITLYDNGEVDGDTVSVLMNGEVIMPMVGLSTRAVRKVIYTKDLPETVQIIMYAENLGSLPPNTGLLIVNDGKDRYEIRFSGDLNKNAAIEFKRKKGPL
ncbi:MAG: hypothetical protein IPL84_05615 [Chitinophagaceae bacterium]|nr:hypothetical protein [Chitinophagaceae bacterium]